MSPQELRQLLESEGLRPLSARGQNFLMDQSVVDRMIAVAGLQAGSRVLEIGPGPGILTEALLEAGAQVVAVEIDPRFGGLLRHRFGDNPNFKLVQQDVLDIGNRELCHLVSGGSDDWQVVANLPYSITSATIERFVLGQPRPKSLTLMLQKEVVDRLLGRPKKTSALTMAVQMVADLEQVCRVPRDSFWPAPKVDSAVIHIKPWSPEKRREFLRGVSEDFLEKVVRTGFSNRRRQLKNSLSHLHLSPEQVKKCLEKAEIPAQARPEELVPEQWVRLAEKILQLEDKSG